MKVKSNRLALFTAFFVIVAGGVFALSLAILCGAVAATMRNAGLATAAIMCVGLLAMVRWPTGLVSMLALASALLSGAALVACTPTERAAVRAAGDGLAEACEPGLQVFDGGKLDTGDRLLVCATAHAISVALDHFFAEPAAPATATTPAVLALQPAGEAIVERRRACALALRAQGYGAPKAAPR
jgi:hypothetical protein